MMASQPLTHASSRRSPGSDIWGISAISSRDTRKNHSIAPSLLNVTSRSRYPDTYRSYVRSRLPHRQAGGRSVWPAAPGSHPARAGRNGCSSIRKITHAAPRSATTSSASRSRIALSSSEERLAHCSSGRGLDHSMTAGSVRSGGGPTFEPVSNRPKEHQDKR